MNLLYVITDLNTGGVPLHLRRLARYVRSRGHSVNVVSLAPPGQVSRLLDQAGVPTASCDAAGPWDWRVIQRLAAIIGDIGPDLVHSFLFHANLAARLAGLLAGFDRRRLVCEIQTVEIERRWHLPVDACTQRLCAWIVGNSASVIEHLATRGRIAPSRLRLIWGGVDVDTIEAAAPVARQQLGVPLGCPLLLWVGRLDPIKGLDVLVEAVRLPGPLGAAHVAIAGDGPYRGALEQLVVQAGLTDRFHLLGLRPDVPGLLKTADAFVFPSRTEGLPNALLEAMAAGLPVVTTDAPGCSDLVRDADTGLIVPPDDPPALAAALAKLLADQSLRVRLGASAAGHVRRNFRLEKCFGEYLALYAEVVGGPTQRRG